MDFVREMQKANEELKLAKKRYEETRVLAQMHCLHERVIQGKMKQSTPISNPSPDFRVCRDCGYSEEGKFLGSYGYSLLTRGNEEDRLNIPEISREEAYKFRKGRTLAYEDHHAVKLGKKSLLEVLRNHSVSFVE